MKLSVNIKCWQLQLTSGNSVSLEKSGSPFEKKKISSKIALGLALKIQHFFFLSFIFQEKNTSLKKLSPFPLY